MHDSIERSAAVAFPIGRLSSYRTGVIYTLAAGLAFGTLGPVSNVAYAAGMGSPTFAAMRATIAGYRSGRSPDGSRPCWR